MLDHQDAIAPEHNDPIHELLEDLGEVPTVESLIGEWTTYIVLYNTNLGLTHYHYTGFPLGKCFKTQAFLRSCSYEFTVYIARVFSAFYTIPLGGAVAIRSVSHREIAVVHSPLSLKGLVVSDSFQMR